jgi:putative ABC transport system permease protein
VATVTIASGMPGADRASRAAQVRSESGRTGRAGIVAVDPSFFQTLGIPIVRGRALDRAEAEGHAAVAVVSEAVAALLWPDQNAIGARLTIATRGGTSTAEVVGVSRNSVDAGGLMRTGLLAPDVYVPLDRRDTGAVLLFARTAGDPRLLLKPVSAAAPISFGGHAARAEVLGQAAAFVHPDSIFVVRLFAGFGLIAMLLAGSGIFGVVSQSVAQRTTEFGVRMAMGASSGRVLRMVLAREAKLIAAAVATGTIATVLVTRSAFVEMLVITGTDPSVWIGVSVLCGGIAAAAVAFATYRIVRLDPWVVLRRT